jgi:hypothetical protein
VRFECCCLGLLYSLHCYCVSCLGTANETEETNLPKQVLVVNARLPIRACCVLPMYSRHDMGLRLTCDKQLFRSQDPPRLVQHLKRRFCLMQFQSLASVAARGVSCHQLCSPNLGDDLKQAI